MTETEKLKEALEAWDGVAINAEPWDEFQDKYDENPCTFVVNAARRWLEVLPLLEDILKGMDLQNGAKFVSKIHGEFTPISVTLTKGQLKQIAAIVAGEE